MGWIAKLVEIIMKFFKSEKVQNVLKTIIMKIIKDILEEIYTDYKSKEKDNHEKKFV